MNTPAEVLHCVRAIARRLDEGEPWTLDAYGELENAAERGNARASGLLSLIDLVRRDGANFNDAKLWERVLDIPRQFTRSDTKAREVIDAQAEEVPCRP